MSKITIRSMKAEAALSYGLDLRLTPGAVCL